MKNNKFFSFIGGYYLIFYLTILVLILTAIFLFSQVWHLFAPLVVIAKTLAGPIVLAFIIYHLLNPVIDFLQRRGVRRVWATIGVMAFVILALVTVSVVLLPLIYQQLVSFVDKLPDTMSHIIKQIEDLSDNSIFGTYISGMNEWLAAHTADIQTLIKNAMNRLPDQLSRFMESVVNVTVIIFTFPFVLFFLLKDGRALKGYFLKLLPPKYRAGAENIMEDMSHQVGSYIQGQLVVSICIGVLLLIGYLSIGMEYALILASVAAVTSIVPYIGPTIAISPAIVLALMDSPWMLMKLIVVWVLVQFLEGHFISPNIMGKTMKIHPLTIIFILLCAGKIFGVLGVILGIPGYAILKVIITHIFRAFKKRYNQYYSDEISDY